MMLPNLFVSLVVTLVIRSVAGGAGAPPAWTVFGWTLLVLVLADLTQAVGKVARAVRRRDEGGA